MTTLLPGLLTRYVLVLIGAQFAFFLLVLVLDAFGWGDSLSSAANVAVLMAAGSSGGTFVAQRLKRKPGWGISLKLSALLAVVAIIAGALLLAGIVYVNGISQAELQILAAQMGLPPAMAALLLAAVSFALSFPVTLVGFRLGAGQVAKHLERHAAVTGI